MFDESAAADYSSPAMTRRALIIGFIAAVVFAVAGRYISAYAHTPAIVRGHLPISVFGLLTCLAILINPLLGRLRSGWRFKGSELALILALMLGVATIVDAGLMRSLLNQCVFPIHNARTQPGWQQARVMEYMPSVMLANDGQYSEEVVTNFITQGEPIAWPEPWYNPRRWDIDEFRRTLSNSWQRVPWGAWWKPLLFWGTLTALSYAAVVGLSVVVHRQWARKERIRYPIAEIVSSILMQDNSGRTTMFTKKHFWVGFAIALFISMLNMVALWFPNFITIPLNINAAALNEAFPNFMQTS
ncbi:MAG TPA: DUF6785 family protein, partial [Sedimentisphaerales bacterium]|nr:DUF6785 family protein [Sedimentisphaerales bacterium]